MTSLSSLNLCPILPKRGEGYPYPLGQLSKMERTGGSSRAPDMQQSPLVASLDAHQSQSFFFTMIDHREVVDERPARNGHNNT